MVSTENPWLSRLAGKTSEEMAAELAPRLVVVGLDLTRFVEAIQALERERCLRVLRKELMTYKGLSVTGFVNIVETAIRALSPAAPHECSARKF